MSPEGRGGSTAGTTRRAAAAAATAAAKSNWHTTNTVLNLNTGNNKDLKQTLNSS